MRKKTRKIWIDRTVCCIFVKQTNTETINTMEKSSYNEWEQFFNDSLEQYKNTDTEEICEEDLNDILNEEVMMELDFESEVLKMNFVESINNRLMSHIQNENLTYDKDEVHPKNVICQWVLSNLLDETEVDILMSYDNDFTEYVKTIDNLEDFLMS